MVYGIKDKKRLFTYCLQNGCSIKITMAYSIYAIVMPYSYSILSMDYVRFTAAYWKYITGSPYALFI